ncbi:hypothetical protein CJ179_47215 [Rhodococcus sp. ACS1]|nr:hypothetical protein CJ179_47215 [Rhodococcus sp. ACS1]
MISAIGLAVPGWAGARLASRIPVDLDALLRAVRAIPDSKISDARVLGIDLSRPRNYPDTGIEAARLMQVRSISG